MAEMDKKDKVDKEKFLPKEAQVMISILRDMGINDFEPRVVNQMLEFSYRYVTNVLEDARVYSQHARKKTIDIDDVKLAVQMQSDVSFTSPPPREVLLELARAKNAVQLPLVKTGVGLRLPPDRHCLTACNYRLKTKNKSSVAFQYGSSGGGSSRSTMSFGAKQSVNKVSLGNSQPSFVVKAPTGVSPSPAAVMSVSGPVVAPGGAAVPQAVFKLQVPSQMAVSQGEKRKREDDDFDTP